MKVKQKTIKKEISFSGIGLHSGKKVNIKFKPAPSNTGILLKRVDVSDNKYITLSAFNITETQLNTTVEENGIKVSTIEHMMAAFSMLGIDNLIIETNDQEIPIMDGSALPFIILAKEAGIVELRENKKFAKIKESITFKENDKYARILPNDDFILNFDIEFNHPYISETPQNHCVNFFKSDIVDGISRARTFGFMKDIEYLKTLNLCKGGSIDNAIVLDEYKVLNKTPMRYKDEFVKHKILDAIGDLYLGGVQIIGYFDGYKSGHDLNNKLLRKVFSNKNNYEIVNYNLREVSNCVGCTELIPEII